MAAEIPGNSVTHFSPTAYARGVVVVVLDSRKKTADSASVTDQRTSARREIGQWSGVRERRESRDEDRNSETAKITFGFKGRYLGNGKSYRLATKSILNGRIPCFLPTL